jgi:hypothetical protein
MQGIVKAFSKNKQRVAVLTEYGYTVFDIENGEVSLNDTIIGNLDDHGSHDLTNQTTRHKISVYIEAIQASLESAQSLLSHR